MIDNLINNLDITIFNKDDDVKIPLNNLIIILTSTSNQKNNEKENNITLNLG